MIQLTAPQKDKIVKELLTMREKHDVTDAMFAKQYKINGSVFSQLKSGKREGLLREAQWFDLARRLNISFTEREWKLVRTKVYNQIEEDILFCQEHSKSMIFVDECEIGKTFTAKHLSRVLKNCFYIDCSDYKSKQLFVRALAQTIGVTSTGKYAEVLANIKYYLSYMPKPMVILDEAGDLDYTAFLELKSLWNATENTCGWYMIGADGLREKIIRGTRNHKVGFAEIFSRYSGNFSIIVPNGKEDKLEFYQELVGTVLKANLKDATAYNKILKLCLTKDPDGRIGGLRRLESLIILNS